MTTKKVLALLVVSLLSLSHGPVYSQNPGAPMREPPASQDRPVGAKEAVAAAPAATGGVLAAVAAVVAVAVAAASSSGSSGTSGTTGTR